MKAISLSLLSFFIVIKGFGQSIDRYMDMAKAHMVLKQYRKALADYNKVLKINYWVYEASQGRAEVELNLKQFKAAISDYDIAMKHCPYEESFKMREAAIVDFIKAAGLYPHEALPYIYIGQLKYKHYDYEEALTFYNKAIEVNPGYAEAYYYRGILKSVFSTDGPCTDFTMAKQLGYAPATDQLKKFCQSGQYIPPRPHEPDCPAVRAGRNHANTGDNNSITQSRLIFEGRILSDSIVSKINPRRTIVFHKVFIQIKFKGDFKSDTIDIVAESNYNTSDKSKIVLSLHKGDEAVFFVSYEVPYLSQGSDQDSFFATCGGNGRGFIKLSDVPNIQKDVYNHIEAITHTSPKIVGRN